jgi:hypothetical protein
MAKKLSLIILRKLWNHGQAVCHPRYPAGGSGPGDRLWELPGYRYILYDYRMLRKSLAATSIKTKPLTNNGKRSEQQRLQIQSFAHEINVLKEKLIRLDRFEEKIRVIANLAPARPTTTFSVLAGRS